jgi:hypothetical protein
VPVRTLARIAMTEQKVTELIAVLQATIDNAAKVRELLDPRGGGQA